MRLHRLPEGLQPRHSHPVFLRTAEVNEFPYAMLFNQMLGQLTHGNLVAFCHWYQRFYDLKPGHHVAAYASYGFDACMMDMYPALPCGASVPRHREGDARSGMTDRERRMRK